MKNMEVITIPMADIFANEEFNCRGHIIPHDVLELAKSIEDQGLIAPVVVTKLGVSGGYQWRLLAGFRRYLAHRVLKKTTIACVINDTIQSEADAIVFNLSENINRKDLNLAQEAKTVGRLLEQPGMNRDTIAEKLGQSPGWVQVRTMLLGLPGEVMQEAAVGMIRTSDVRDLYTNYNRERKASGENAARELILSAVHDLKVMKERGEKKTSVSKALMKNADKDIKKHRSRVEIFNMLDHVIDHLGAGLYTRSLAWCAGQITTEEFEEDLKRVAEKRNIHYPSIKDTALYE